MSLLFMLMPGGYKDGVLSVGTGGFTAQLDPVAPYDTTVAIRFNADGTVETGKEINGGGISWTSSGVWIDDASKITGNEEVRVTNVNVTSGTGDFTLQTTADDVWGDISVGPSFESNKTDGGTRIFAADFEVRDTSTGDAAGPREYTFQIINVV